MRFTLPALLGVVATTFFAATANATFDLAKRNNMVLYWGQNSHGLYDKDPEKQQKSLLAYCKDTNVDLISVGFLNDWNSTGGQPIVNFSTGCTGYQMFPDTKLLWCPTIGADILACQAMGKKILLSIGGAADTYTGFKSAAEADAFAYKVWDMFGRGWTYYRPFGEAIVDGFDFDIETLPALFYENFAYRLRKLSETDTTKKYFLTATPQCMNPDKYLETALRKAAFDAIFVQFYNNPSCSATMWKFNGDPQLTNAGFNFGLWNRWVSTNSKNKGLKVFLTLPASPKVAPSGGYVSKEVAANIIADLARFPTFGGVAIWDASETAVNTGYVAAVKDALNKLPSGATRRYNFFGLW